MNKKSPKDRPPPKKLEEYKQSHPFQMVLFQDTELDRCPKTEKYSNTVELYDAIPKYHWGNQERKLGQFLDVVERDFVHQRQAYKVAIQPARIKGKDGVYRDCFPGQREELVEDALRKIACDGGHGRYLDDTAGVVFTLHQLQQELQRMGHGYNKNEIKEAIMILGSSIMNVQTKDGKSLVIMPFFETVGLRSCEDWKGCGPKTRAYVRFNSLVTESINSKTFRLLNYNKSMSYKRILARWLHKRLSHNYRQASINYPYTINLLTIIRDSGSKQYPRLSNNSRQVIEALEEMKEKKVLSEYETTNILEGRKIVDVQFTLFPHQHFISEITFSNWRQSDGQRKAFLGRNKR